MRQMHAILFIIAWIPLNAISAEIRCYSGKTQILHAYGHTITFSDNAMSFIENKTKRLIVTSGDCIILVPTDEKDNFDAVDLR